LTKVWGYEYGITICDREAVTQFEMYLLCIFNDLILTLPQCPLKASHFIE